MTFAQIMGRTDEEEKRLESGTNLTFDEIMGRDKPGVSPYSATGSKSFTAKMTQASPLMNPKPQNGIVNHPIQPAAKPTTFISSAPKLTAAQQQYAQQHPAGLTALGEIKNTAENAAGGILNYLKSLPQKLTYQTAHPIQNAKNNLANLQNAIKKSTGGSMEDYNRSIVQSPLKSAATHFENAATLGLIGLPGKLTGSNEWDNLMAQTQAAHPTESTVGEMAGYALPGTVMDKIISKAAAPVLKRVGTTVAGNIAAKATTGALSNSALAALNDFIHGKSLKETAKDAALNAAVGGAFGTLGGLANKSAIAKNVNKGWVERLGPQAQEGMKYNVFSPEELEAQQEKLRALTNAGNISNPSAALPDTMGKIVSGEKTNLQKLKAVTTPTVSQPKGALSRAYTRTVDVLNPIKQFSKAAAPKSAAEDPYVLAMNASDAGGISRTILNEHLVDKQGKVIGNSFKSVINEIPKDQQKEFQDYLLNKHNVSRTDVGKPVFATDTQGNPVTAELSKQKVADYESRFPQFKKASADLNDWTQKFSKAWGVDTGMVQSEVMDALHQQYPNYVPTYRSFDEIERAGDIKNAAGKFVDQPNLLKKATGSDRPVINPLKSLNDLVQKTVKAAKFNEVGQTVYDALKKDPEGLRNFAEILPESGGKAASSAEGIENGVSTLNQQWGKASSDLTRNNVVRVMVDGKPKYLQINDKDFLNSLTNLNASGKTSKLITNGNKVYRGLITTYNPIFAARNIARDVPTYMINGTENNPLKALYNLGRSVKGMATNSPEFQEYKALGGGGGGFLRQNYSDLNKNGILSKLAKLNDFTEQAPRYAEYLATKDKLGSGYGATQKALYNANEVTTNFARHGDITKSADKYVPYLNAGVQGLDKVARQIVTHPVGTVAKGAIAVTLPTAALLAINGNNPNYQALDNRTKDNYFLIPNENDKDDKGNPQSFIKIPKSREYGVLFGSLFERLTRLAAGGKQPFKGFASTVATNLAPNNPANNNLFSPLLYNIPKNKDFANRAIVPSTLQNLSPKYQYDDQTSEIAKTIGKTFNLSPKQIDYLIKSYTGVIGQLGIPAATKSTYEGKAGKGLATPFTSQFTASPLYNSQALQDFYDNMQKAQQAAADRNFTENIPSKTVTPEETLRGKFTKAQKQLSTLQKQINQTSDQDKIKKMREQMVQLAANTNKLIQ